MEERLLCHIYRSKLEYLSLEYMENNEQSNAVFYKTQQHYTIIKARNEFQSQMQLHQRWRKIYNVIIQAAVWPGHQD